MSQKGMQALKQQLSGQPPAEVNRYDFFKGKLEQNRSDLQLFLGSKVAVDRFIHTCVSATIENPQLLEADMRSLLTACKKAANANLKPDGREAVLNVYNTKTKDRNGDWVWIKRVQFLPMVAGVIKTIYRGGATYVDAAAVYDEDEFSFERGDQTRLLHKPTMADDPGPIVAAYAVVKTEDGEIKREVMFKRDIDKVRSKSKTSDKGPWVEWPDQMAIKSVLHRIRKQLSIDDENLDRLLEQDNEAMGYTTAGTMNQNSAQSLDFSPSDQARFNDPDIGGSMDSEEEMDLRPEPEPEAKKSAQKSERKPAEKSAGDSVDDSGKPESMTMKEIFEMLNDCQSIDALDMAEGFISSVESEADRKILDEKAEKVRKQLKAKN